MRDRSQIGSLVNDKQHKGEETNRSRDWSETSENL